MKQSQWCQLPSQFKQPLSASTFTYCTDCNCSFTFNKTSFIAKYSGVHYITSMWITHQSMWKSKNDHILYVIVEHVFPKPSALICNYNSLHSSGFSFHEMLHYSAPVQSLVWSRSDFNTFLFLLLYVYGCAPIQLQEHYWGQH